MAISQSLKNSLGSIARSTEDAVEMETLLNQIGAAPTGPLISSFRKASAQATAGGYALVPVAFQTNDVNDENRMSASGVYTVVDSGIYEIIALLHITGITPTLEGNILVISDTLGDSVAAVKIPPGNLDGTATVQMHAVRSLTAGDVLTVNTRSSDPFTVLDGLYGGDQSHFTVKKIR